MAHMLRGSVVGTVSLCLAAAFSVVAVPSVQAATNADQVGITAAPTVRASSKPAFSSAAARYGVTNSKSVRNLQTLLIRKRYATAGPCAGGCHWFVLQTNQSIGQEVPAEDRLWQGIGNGIIEKRSAKKLGLKWVASSNSANLSVSGGLTTGTNGSALSPTQLKSVLVAAGFTEPYIRTAWGIAMRESRGYPVWSAH